MSKQRRRSYRDFADMSGFEIELPSSPDPLGDDEDPSDSAPVPPSTTRRLVQSTASSRFTARPGTSPRKRMFALDVGNEITPQTIYVTVEAGQDAHAVTNAPAVGTSVRRRLFGSPTPQPSPQRKVRTTTTTVPLRGLTDDEGGPTPRRRRRSSTGRPGTPAAASAKKKKRGTPTPKAKKSPKKPRASRGPSSDVDVLQADTPAVTPKRRGRPPKRKLSEEPAEQDDPNATQALPRKKGGRRRDDIGGPSIEEDAGPAPRSNDDGSAGRQDVPEDPVSGAAIEKDWVAVQAEDEGDLWMDNMSDPPVANDIQEIQADRGATISKSPGAPASDHAESELDYQGALPGESDDYAPMMDNDDRSDVGSRHSEPVPDAERNPDELEDQGPLPGESDDYAPTMEQDDRSDAESQDSEQPADFRDPAAFRDELDHTVDPESFTMIGLDSIHSYRASRNVATSDPAEMGEDTSLFINKTLESLRQEIAESDEEDVDILASRDQTPALAEPETQAPTSLSARTRRRVSQSPATQSSRRAPRSPRKNGSVTGSTAQGERHENIRSSTRSVNGFGAEGAFSQREEYIDDEDSFSDIPEEALAAAESDEHLYHEELGPAQREVASTVPLDIDSSHSDASSRDQNNGDPQHSHATPSHLGHYQVDIDQDISQPSASRSAQSRRSNQLMEGDSPPQSLRSRTDSNRLLTPDATTSSSTQSPPVQQNDKEEDEGPMAPDDVGSSPPEITTFIEQNERPLFPSRRSSDTPANPGPEIHVEHVQERPTFAAILQPGLLGGSRPTLSPVVRIGRTLQNILSDPPSPSGASSVLGSPFKGSVRNSSPLDGAAVDEASPSDTTSDDAPQKFDEAPAPRIVEAPVQSPAKSWTMSLAPLSQLKNLVTQGAMLFTSPRGNASHDTEDPFAPSSPTLDKALDNTRNSAFMDRIRQASREDSRPSSSVGTRATAGDDTNMHHAAIMASSQPPVVIGLGRSSNSLLAGSAAPQTSERRRIAAPVGYDGAHDQDADGLRHHRSMTRFDRPRVDECSSDMTILQEPEIDDHIAEDGDIEMEEQQQMAEDYLNSTTRDQELDHAETCADEDEMETDERQSVADDSAPLATERQDPAHLEIDDEDDEPEVDGADAGMGADGAEVNEDDAGMDEVAAHIDDATVRETSANEEEDEDIWAIEADRTASSPQFAASQQDTSNLFRKSELSVDWGTRSTNSQGTAHPNRSPAFNSRRSNYELPPEDLEDYSLVDLHSGTPTQPSAKKPTPEQQQQPKQVDLSDFFSSSPNFIERQRRAKKASLAKSAPHNAIEKPAEVAYPDVADQGKSASLQAPKPLPNAPRSTRNIPPPARGASQGTRNPATLASSSATPEQARHRPPGRRITPRRAENDAALFESWSVSSRAPTERPLTSEASSTPRAATPLVRESSTYESPDLRPLPRRAASPSKSCLRSPLKPKTPGRLVEFTSSTLSESAPLQALVNSQKNLSVGSTSNNLLAGPSFPGKENQTAASTSNTFARPSFPGKENQTAVSASNHLLPGSSFAGKADQTAAPNHIFSQASPQQKMTRQSDHQAQGVDSPLSQTRWSRDHWLYLDDLWKEYQDSPLEFPLRHSNAVMVSPGKRPSSRLLGKVVFNQGESVELQQMHLDIVDAFKNDVGGWNEESLAKRLFALVVGAERRRLGLVPRRR